MSIRSLLGFKNSEKHSTLEYITVVSGLPRSGTSMMMRMIEAGGMEIVTDHLRTPDDSNPKGYYEFETVKKLKDGDRAWVGSARGKAVKVISALLEYLPREYTYQVIFMRRDIHEILASQKKMLIDRGEPTDKVSDEKMAELYRNHLSKVEGWLKQQPNMKTLFVNYNEVLANPDTYLDSINRFLSNRLEVSNMRQVIDKNLYRQRNRA